MTVVTTRKILSTLQQLLGYAVNRDMIGINVAKEVKVIGRRDEGARKIVPPTKEAMRALSRSPKRIFGSNLPLPARPASALASYMRFAGIISILRKVK